MDDGGEGAAKIVGMASCTPMHGTIARSFVASVWRPALNSRRLRIGVRVGATFVLPGLVCLLIGGWRGWRKG